LKTINEASLNLNDALKESDYKKYRELPIPQKVFFLQGKMTSCKSIDYYCKEGNDFDLKIGSAKIMDIKPYYNQKKPLRFGNQMMEW